MASRRSAQNGASSTAPTDPTLVQRLLIEGKTHPNDAAHGVVAKFLEQTDIIVAPCLSQFVQCRNEMDADYRWSRADCFQFVPIPRGADEDDGEIRCPQCERIIKPIKHAKQRFDRLAPKLNHDGIQRWLQDRVAKIGTVNRMAAGVWSCKASHWQTTRFVVLVEHVDHQSEYVTEAWALGNRVIFIAINPDTTGMDSASWFAPTSLASVMTGAMDLASLLDQAPEIAQKPRVQAMTRLYSTGRRDVQFHPAQPASTGRQFILELTDRQLLINDKPILQANATSQMGVIKILLEIYSEDMGANVPIGEYRSLTIGEIADCLARHLGKTSEAFDNETARTAINRFQREVAEKWKKTVGSPINDHDIIQTMSGINKEGYRLNPSTVIIRPRRG